MKLSTQTHTHTTTPTQKHLHYRIESFHGHSIPFSSIWRQRWEVAATCVKSKEGPNKNSWDAWASTSTCTHIHIHIHMNTFTNTYTHTTITSWELVSSLCAVGGQPSPATLRTELAADTTSGRLTRLPLWCHDVQVVLCECVDAYVCDPTELLWCWCAVPPSGDV